MKKMLIAFIVAVFYCNLPVLGQSDTNSFMKGRSEAIKK
jgi:hypothetical protein